MKRLVKQGDKIEYTFEDNGTKTLRGTVLGFTAGYVVISNKEHRGTREEPFILILESKLYNTGRIIG